MRTGQDTGLWAVSYVRRWEPLQIRADTFSILVDQFCLYGAEGLETHRFRVQMGGANPA